MILDDLPQYLRWEHLLLVVRVSELSFLRELSRVLLLPSSLLVVEVLVGEDELQRVLRWTSGSRDREHFGLLGLASNPSMVLLFPVVFKIRGRILAFWTLVTPIIITLLAGSDTFSALLCARIRIFLHLYLVVFIIKVFVQLI